MAMKRAAAVMLSVAGLLGGCAAAVPGTATWPGAALNAAMLQIADFPPGVLYDRIIERPGVPDGAGVPGSMLSRPEGCSNALTNVIANSAERGPGSAAKYAVTYDGARMVITLLSWNLDLDSLRAAADRCAKFEAFFAPDSPAIPITTTTLTGLEPQALAYQQTMKLSDAETSVFMAFQNVGDRAVFGIAFPAPDSRVEAKATLPQTFLDVFTKQISKLRSY